MTPARLTLEGRYYREHPKEPFAETVYLTDGDPYPVLTLSFLWEATGLKHICQARLAGFAARGQHIRLKKRLTLHDSDFCSVYAFLGADSMMTIEVVEKIIEFEGQEYAVLSQFCPDEHWAAHPTEASFGVMVKAEQLPHPVRVMGTLTQENKGVLVTNLIYAVRQSAEPHPAEEPLRTDIERVRSGTRLPWFAPKMAVGMIFGREVTWIKNPPEEG